MSTSNNSLKFKVREGSNGYPILVTLTGKTVRRNGKDVKEEIWTGMHLAEVHDSPEYRKAVSAFRQKYGKQHEKIVAKNRAERLKKAKTAVKNLSK
jgi:hypothetical protein